MQFAARNEFKDTGFDQSEISPCVSKCRNRQLRFVVHSGTERKSAKHFTIKWRGHLGTFTQTLCTGENPSEVRSQR